MKTRLERFDQKVEKTDEARLDQAAKSIREVFPTDRWAELSPNQRHWHLDRVGRELNRVYQCGEPMTFERPMQETKETIHLGSYVDKDYRIDLNEKLLETPDPRRALETFAHEWRHNIQTEQIQCFRKGFGGLRVNESQVEAWSKNREYIRPEDNFEAYREQAIETDARDFASRFVNKVIGR